MAASYQLDISRPLQLALYMRFHLAHKSSATLTNQEEFEMLTGHRPSRPLALSSYLSGGLDFPPATIGWPLIDYELGA